MHAEHLALLEALGYTSCPRPWFSRHGRGLYFRRGALYLAFIAGTLYASAAQEETWSDRATLAQANGLDALSFALWLPAVGAATFKELLAALGRERTLDALAEISAAADRRRPLRVA